MMKLFTGEISVNFYVPHPEGGRIAIRLMRLGYTKAKEAKFMSEKWNSNPPFGTDLVRVALPTNKSIDDMKNDIESVVPAELHDTTPITTSTL